MTDDRTLARGMQVLTSDGELLGTVEGPASSGFMLRRMGPNDAAPETVPKMWVHRIDESVHLNRTGAEALAGWKSMQFETSSGERPGAPEPARADADQGGRSWLIWLVLAIVVLGALLLLSQL